MVGHRPANRPTLRARGRRHILDFTMTTILNRKPVLKLGVVDLGVESVTLPNGVQTDLAVIRHPGASAIVALDSDGNIAMLNQYRHAVGAWMREIPAGCRNAGENP